jgi:hypothetical protein
VKFISGGILVNDRKTFLWLAPEHSGKSRPKGAGWDILAAIYGDENYTAESRVLPECSNESGCDVETGVKLLRGGMCLVEADYLIVEGCRISIILGLLEDPDYEDRILIPRRGDLGEVERFEIVLAELATKPFPPE